MKQIHTITQHKNRMIEHLFTDDNLLISPKRIKFNKCVFKSKQPSLNFMYTKQEPFLSTCIRSM